MGKSYCFGLFSLNVFFIINLYFKRKENPIYIGMDILSQEEKKRQGMKIRKGREGVGRGVGVMIEQKARNGEGEGEEAAAVGRERQSTSPTAALGMPTSCLLPLHTPTGFLTPHSTLLLFLLSSSLSLSEWMNEW